MLENLFLMDIFIKKFDIIVLIIFFVWLLFKVKFCIVFGYFISKLIWIDLLDCDIINWFGWICRNFFYYYSGFLKK